MEGFVNHSLGEGYTVEQIRLALINQGWSEELLDSSLDEVLETIREDEILSLKDLLLTMNLSNPQLVMSNFISKGYDPHVVRAALLLAGKRVN